MIARATNVFTMRRTLCKMLSRRDYTVPSSIANEPFEVFQSAYINHKLANEVEETSDFQLDFTVTHKRDGGNKLMVFFPGDTEKNNLGISHIRNYLAAMETENVCRAILVVHDSLTAPAVLTLKDLELKGTYIAFFSEQELMYDIYEHSKVPRHIVLTPGEEEELLRTLRATEDLLPKMQKQDPMARYLGLRVGDVVKILRYSYTVAHDVYYRIVVDSEDFQ